MTTSSVIGLCVLNKKPVVCISAGFLAMGSIFGVPFIRKILGRVLLRPTKCAAKGALLTLLAGFGCYAALQIYRYCSSPNNEYFMHLKTKYIRKTRVDVQGDPTKIKTWFNQMQFISVKPQLAHTHALAAMDRTKTKASLDHFGKTIGREVYYIQRSKNDEDLGRLGSRSYFWTKDTTAEPSPVAVPQNPLVVLGDVDMYIDMPHFLNTHPHPTVVFTFQPDKVAKETKNYAYTFNDKNQVVYTVSGGGGYIHEIWNWSLDDFVVKKKILGLTYKAISYSVTRRATSDDHEIVLVVPTGIWTGLGAFFHDRWVESRDLKRLQVVTPSGHCRLQTFSKEKGLMISTGRPMTYLEASIKRVVDDSIASENRTLKYPMTVAHVANQLGGDRTSAPPLLEYYRSNRETITPDMLCPVEEAVQSYQFKPFLYDEMAPTPLVPFMHPFVGGAYVPARCRGNEEQSVEGRIERVRPPIMPLTVFISRCIDEFSEQLVSDDNKNTLAPVSLDVVWEKQHRPAQRRLLEEVGNIDPNVVGGTYPEREIKSFQKSESYAKIADPRNISTINSADKRDYSCYTYAFGNLLKTTPWYAFGSTPLMIATRVTQILSKAEYAVNTDFSRFDGHGSNIMRELERVVLLRTFAVQYHEELITLHGAQYGLKARATFGTKYDTEYTRASGSPETGVLNSLVNAFVAFLAMRMSVKDGCWVKPSDSYFRLGIYGGDDGLTADVPAEVYERAASCIGQQLTVDVVHRGQLGIKFLARVYSPMVWDGELSTCADLPRAVPKFHLSVNLGRTVTHLTKLLEKVRGYILTDKNTPILGEFCSAVMKNHKDEINENEQTFRMRAWLSKFGADDQYPNEPGDWMLEYLSHAMPAFDYKKFKSWLGQANTYEKLMTPPLFQEPLSAKSDIPVIVNGDLAPFGMTWPVEQRKFPNPPVHSNVPTLTPEQFKVFKEKKQREGKWVQRPWDVNRPKVCDDRKVTFQTPDVRENKGEPFEHVAHQAMIHHGPKGQPFGSKLPSYEQAVAFRDSGDAHPKSNLRHPATHKNSVGRSFSKNWRRDGPVRDAPQ
jgi:hypothetical protein